MEISHVPSCYGEKKLPLLKSTQLIFFDKIHIKQVSGSLTTIFLKEYNVLFTRDEEGKVDVEIGFYETNNQPKRVIFKYEQEGIFCVSVAKVESKEYGEKQGSVVRCFIIQGGNVTIDAYKKKIDKLLERIRKLTLSSSAWAEKMKAGKI